MSLGTLVVYCGSLTDEMDIMDILCRTLLFTFIIKGPSVSISYVGLYVSMAYDFQSIQLAKSSDSISMSSIKSPLFSIQHRRRSCCILTMNLSPLHRLIRTCILIINLKFATNPKEIILSAHQAEIRISHSPQSASILSIM